ncbi:MAG: ASCH domain-containing protein [Planctomycetes bacterium]|nr:ASCH domain-containing protein [Planctomycetota bacterium]
MTAGHPDPELIALGVRQPWVELILRGVKTVEVRSQNTHVRGPIYLYAAKKFSTIDAAVLAAGREKINLETLPLGMIVGTVEIVDCQPSRRKDVAAACVPSSYLKHQFSWRLENPQPLETPLNVRFLPYGVWFYPFRRRVRS